MCNMTTDTFKRGVRPMEEQRVKARALVAKRRETAANVRRDELMKYHTSIIAQGGFD